MRTTPYKWWCYRGHENPPSVRECQTCCMARFEKHAQVHVSERAVVYVHPDTGQRVTPARADQPMPEVYARQGFERQEIMSMTQYERQTGLVHEATNFSPGNEPIPVKDPVPTMSKEVREGLIKDVVDAMASGPWTGHDKFD